MTIKAGTLRALDDGALQKKLDELKKDLMIEMTQVKAGGRAPNPGRLKNLKKSIAVVLTVIHERKLDIKRKREIKKSGKKAGKKTEALKPKEEKSEEEKTEKEAGEKVEKREEVR